MLTHSSPQNSGEDNLAYYSKDGLTYATIQDQSIDPEDYESAEKEIVPAVEEVTLDGDGFPIDDEVESLLGGIL